MAIWRARRRRAATQRGDLAAGPFAATGGAGIGGKDGSLRRSGSADARGAKIVAMSQPAAAAPHARHFMIEGRPVVAPPLPGGLYLVATPIGNLRDVTLRALETLAAADLIACEDTRVTRRLTEHYGICTPLTPYHEHNAAEARPRLIARLAAGATVALVSDAGTPLVSDPGYKLAREARAAGHAVTALPGASAVLAALTLSALPTDRFFFEGFLPAKAGPRRARIAELKGIPATLVLFETGPRLAATLADLAAALGAREAAVCRELTKLHEEVRRGEMVIVVAPPVAREAPAEDLDVLLQRALDRLSVKEAVSEVAAVTGQPRRAVYQRALTLIGARRAGEETGHGR
jgi:16S rRNA (cytidine1402-2'-O)-methyltransferase